MAAHRVDTHIHIIPPAIRAAIEKAGGDPSGWHIPDWTPELALAFCDRIGVQKAVWSITAPGPAIAGTGPEARQVCVTCNDEVAAICAREPDRFAYFASLPSLLDVEGCLTEIERAFTLEPAPQGFVIMTTYGDALIGDERFDSIWRKFDEKKAIVFVHPTAVDITPKLIANTLPQPTIDYPHQSTRAATDLLLRGHLRRHANCKIILSHAGGSLPFIFTRILQMLAQPKVAQMQKATSLEHAKQDVKLFYFDVAMSTTRGQLMGLLELADPKRILYGSDHPHASEEPVADNTKRWDELLATDKELSVLSAANSDNARRLFGW